MGQSNIFQKIKEEHPLLDYAKNELGMQLRQVGSGFRGKSINPGNNDTCLCIYDDQNRWYDFKECVGGDVIDLCALVLHGGDRGAAIRELGGVEYGNWEQYSCNLDEQILNYHQMLRPEDMDYLHSRRITDKTIARLKIGYNAGEGRLIIPFFKYGHIVYYIGRDRTGSEGAPKYKKAALDNMNEHVPWGLHTLARQEDTLVIAEGAFDAISFEQEGFMVLSPMGGGFSSEQMKQVVSIARNAKNTCICFDSDDAGRGFSKKTAEIFFRERLPFTYAQLPAGFKDVSDYYSAGGNLRDLVSNARPGLAALAGFYDDPHVPEEKRLHEFKDFVLQAARSVDEADLAMLLNATSFPKNWLKALEKQALRAPEESEIASSIVKKRSLLFNERTGFYEYANGVWESRDDTVMQNHIKEELGRFATGARLNRILTLLKAETVSSESLNFNKKSLMNFNNGTLELDTGVFRGHNEDDLLSFKLPYKYDPEARCPRWTQFLEEITWSPEKKLRDDEGDARQKVLQEIAGYVLFADNRLQKSFFLLGTGANGKSTFLNVLAGVYGRENVSHIEISQLGKDFHAIGLKDALMNISSEVRGSLDGAEDNFKKIVAGDAIRDSFKGKDQLDFVSRAKMLVACNRLPRSCDPSYGFLRRILFLEFQNRFVDGEPDEKSNERRADKNLEDELKKELSGIFNWAYKGYKRLLEQGDFSESPDHNRIMREFAALANPLVDFIETHIAGEKGDFPHGKLYNMYSEWCTKTGHVRKGNRAFFPELKMTLQEMKIPFDHKKSRELCFVF